jgi:hypothetical protein
LAAVGDVSFARPFSVGVVISVPTLSSMIGESSAKMGFAIITQLMELKFEIDVINEIQRIFLGFIAAFASQMPNRDGTIEWLIFTGQIKRIESSEGFETAQFLFKMWVVIRFHPLSEDGIMGLAITLAKQGYLKGKFAVLRYLRALVVEWAQPLVLVLTEDRELCRSGPISSTSD